MGSFGGVNEIGGSRGRTQGRREFFRNMPCLTNTRGEYLALAVLHDLDSADEIVVYYDSVNGLGFRLKHRLHTFFYVQDIPYRVPEKPRSLSQPVVFYRVRDEGL